MYISKGNNKTGPCLIVNRPVGDTCPNSCPLLNNGCYRQNTERRWKNTRLSAFRNTNLLKKEALSVIQQAIKEGKPIRLHEGGEFLKTDKLGRKILDRKYINAWRLAIRSTPKKDRPNIWVYTHVYRREVSSLAKLGVHVYASVHNQQDISLAKKAGFKLFAFVSEVRKSAKDKPKYTELPIIGRTLVCPEQRMGYERVNCVKCKWCVRGMGNVLFLKH